MVANTLTDRAKRVLDLAEVECRNLGHNWVGTEHILLGILVEGNSVAAAVLSNLGVDLVKVRTEIDRLILPPHEMKKP